MSIFRKIKAQKIVDGVFSGVDKAILSKEELMDYSIKAAELNLEHLKTTYNESTPRSITRRIIAIMILGQYFLSFNIGLLGRATGWYEGKEIMLESTDAFSSIALAVVIFYFGNHILNNIIPRFASKKK